MGSSPGRKSETRELVKIQGSSITSLGMMHLNKEEVRQKCQEACMDNKESLWNKPKHRKEACRGWKQKQVAWEEHRGVIWATRHQSRKGRALRELNLDRETKGNRKNCTLVVKGRLGKIMWALSIRDQETWLPRIWRRLKYSMTFLPLSWPASAPATLPKSQNGKARIGIMRNGPL